MDNKEISKVQGRKLTLVSFQFVNVMCNWGCKIYKIPLYLLIFSNLQVKHVVEGKQKFESILLSVIEIETVIKGMSSFIIDRSLIMLVWKEK